MTYPSDDQAVIDTARQNYEAACRAVATTEAAITTTTAALAEAKNTRAGLVSKAATGGSVSPQQHRAAEDSIRHKELELLRHQDILKIQETERQRLDGELTKAQGLACRPKVVHALRVIRAAEIDLAAAQAALDTASRAAGEARQVIQDCFSRRFPMPDSLIPKNGQVWTGPHLDRDKTEAELRRTWGELAEEAFAETASVM